MMAFRAETWPSCRRHERVAVRRKRRRHEPRAESRASTKMDIEWPFYLSALAAGGLWGYVSQRGGFCLVRAVSNMVLMGDATILRAYGLALLVAMIGVQALQAGGLVEIPIRPFHWLSNVTGGLIFGAGMMLGGGCSGSTWYRTGEGAVGAWIILLGFALGATAARLGILGPLRAALQAPTIGDVP